MSRRGRSTAGALTETLQEREQRLIGLERDASDRRDWDECNRLERELTKVRAEIAAERISKLPLSRETPGGKGDDPRQIARAAAAEATRVLVRVMNGQGGRNSAAQVTAAMRILDLAGVLEQPAAVDGDTARRVVVAPSEVARASALLSQERGKALDD